MNKLIEELAAEAGFSKDKYGLYWDDDSNKGGVDLERFADELISELSNRVVRDTRIDWFTAVQISRDMRDLLEN